MKCLSVILVIVNIYIKKTIVIKNRNLLRALCGQICNKLLSYLHEKYLNAPGENQPDSMLPVYTQIISLCGQIRIYNVC